MIDDRDAGDDSVDDDDNVDSSADVKTVMF